MTGDNEGMVNGGIVPEGARKWRIGQPGCVFTYGQAPRAEMMSALKRVAAWPELSVECKVFGHSGCAWDGCDCQCHETRPQVGDTVRILGAGGGIAVVAWKPGGFQDAGSDQ